MNTRHLLCLAAGALLCNGLSAQSTPATADQPPSHYTVGTGFDFSRGHYSLATATDVLSVPLTLGYERGPWTFEVRIPWMRIEGPATVVSGGGASPVRPTAAAESGVGDTLLSGTYRLGGNPGGLNTAATIRAKLPTASESRGLGTGEADFSGQFDFHRSFGAVTPFASVGYAALGDSSLYQLEDGPYASGGAHFRASDSTVFTAAFNWRHRYFAGGEHGRDALLAVTYDLGPRWRVLLYGLKGFSDASPDHGGGLSATCRF
ncbi:MAG: hypothetical protein ACOZE5_17390 [Verrucomicrobiota bacterium]